MHEGAALSHKVDADFSKLQQITDEKGEPFSLMYFGFDQYQ